MKLYIEHEKHIRSRNIHGDPVNVEDRYFVYCRKWFRKKYINFIPFEMGVVPDAMWIEPEKIRKVKCTLNKNKKDAIWYSKEGAEFLVQDSIANPDKYLDSASISPIDFTMYYHGLS